MVTVIDSSGVIRKASARAISTPFLYSARREKANQKITLWQFLISRCSSKGVCQCLFLDLNENFTKKSNEVLIELLYFIPCSVISELLRASA